MEALAAPPRRAKRRRPEEPAIIPLQVAATSAPESSPPGAGGDEPYIQDPPPGADGVDRISSLPDAILGEVISLLPTKDAARTQILATRWRHLWHSAPFNLDGGDELPAVDFVTRILSAHRGPGRRFRFASKHIQNDPATVDAWLRSPALDNLQVIDCFPTYGLQLPHPPASMFRFSPSLCVATFSQCHLSDAITQALQFPMLKKLVLQWISISEDSLHSIIATSPVLGCLLLHAIYGLGRVRINSPSLTSVGVSVGYNPTMTNLEEFIVEDAPRLKRILYLQSSQAGGRVSVISAPNLKTLGFPNSYDYSFNSCRLVLGSMIFESYQVGHKNLWGRKHRNLIKGLDIRLKTVVLNIGYRGIKSQVNFATFFVLNAKMLESMTFQYLRYDVKEGFLAEQHQLLQLEKKASRCARFYFTTRRCDHGNMDMNRAHDLSKTDPFECEETRAGVCASFE